MTHASGKYGFIHSERLGELPLVDGIFAQSCADKGVAQGHTSFVSMVLLMILLYHFK